MNNNAEFLKQNGLSVAKEFHRFVESSVIPATSLDAKTFWNKFSSVVKTVSGDMMLPTPTSATLSDDITIQVRACAKPVNAAWGSLYNALYNDDLIPHSAGLKPGSRINVARRDRVINCAKGFLDKTFPLSEGSHRDAVSYMAYFQNLLVILADGSTTGLKDPKQFIGKNGPSDAPDGILLAHNGTHTEILFDRNGKTGANDLASIEDIQLETTSKTLFDFDASTPEEKSSTYNNWQAIVRCQSAKTFSNRDGESCSIQNKNWAITSTATDDQCTLVLDEQGEPVAEAVIDIITAALIDATHGTRSATMNLYIADSTGINETFIAELQQLLTLSRSTQSELTQQTNITVFRVSADNRPNSANRAGSSDSECAASPVTATIDTMQSHGYDATQILAS